MARSDPSVIGSAGCAAGVSPSAFLSSPFARPESTSVDAGAVEFSLP